MKGVLYRYWLRVIDWVLGAPATYKAFSVEDAPEIPGRGAVYLVGDANAPWFAAMRCPCGCGRTLEMNLLPDDDPMWRVERHRDTSITLHPSIWLKTGCLSHFFLRRGKIEWVTAAQRRRRISPAH